MAKEVQSDANPTGVVTWLHSDPLGSATLATNASGQPLAGSETRYSPFGSVRFGGAGLPHDRRFNGNTTDIAGLLDFGARAYDPLIGRFVSADTIVPNSADPQTLNRFAFVTNNPLKYNDPTGHQGSCVLTGSCPSPFFGGREGAELVGYLIGLGYVTGNAIAATDNTLSTPLNVAPAAPNNTAGAMPNVQQPLVLADPNIAVTSAGVVEAYPAGQGAVSLQLTTPLGESSTLQTASPLLSASIPTINISKKLYGAAAKHIEDAQNAGYPDVLTIDRPNAAQRRSDAMNGKPRIPFYERDEYPPAMFEEGGTGASVRYVNAKDNRACGAAIGNACRPYQDGTKVRIKVVEE